MVREVKKMTKMLNVRINDSIAKEFKEVCEKMGRTQSDVLTEVVFKTVFEFNENSPQFSIEYMRYNQQSFTTFIQKLKDADKKGLFEGVYNGIDELLKQLKTYEDDLSALAISCGDGYTEYFDADCMDGETDSDIDAIQRLYLGNQELRIHMRFKPFEEESLSEWKSLEIVDAK